MKKILTIISLIMIVVISFSLSACYTDIVFFSKSVLEENLVPDLPRIKSVFAYKENKRLYRFKTTEDEFNNYVSSVYEYLYSLNFKYFGYRGEEISSFFGGAPTYEFYLGSELSDFKYTEDRGGHKLENCYVFVWANEINSETNKLSGDHYLELQYYTHKTGAFEYNVYIDLNFGIQSYRLIES